MVVIGFVVIEGTVLVAGFGKQAVFTVGYELPDPAELPPFTKSYK